MITLPHRVLRAMLGFAAPGQGLRLDRGCLVAVSEQRHSMAVWQLPEPVPARFTIAREDLEALAGDAYLLPGMLMEVATGTPRMIIERPTDPETDGWRKVFERLPGTSTVEHVSIGWQQIKRWVAFCEALEVDPGRLMFHHMSADRGGAVTICGLQEQFAGVSAQCDWGKMDSGMRNRWVLS